MNINDNNSLIIRTELLNYALIIEEDVNKILVSHLAVLDKSISKNFGKKAGISFKSKIDLLFDINVLSQEEHNNLELLMNFRNKFLHDINCISFEYAINEFDKGIVNRFKKFIDEECVSENEESYKKACLKLFLHNQNILSNKFENRKKSIDDKIDFIEGYRNAYTTLLSISVDLVNEITEILDNSDEYEKNKVLYSGIIEKLKKFLYEFENNKDLEYIKKNEQFSEKLLFDLLK